MDTQKDFAGEKRTRIGMKYPKILIGILLLLFLSVISPVFSGEPVSSDSHPANQEKKGKMPNTKKWYRKGITFFLNLSFPLQYRWSPNRSIIGGFPKGDFCSMHVSCLPAGNLPSTNISFNLPPQF